MLYRKFARVGLFGCLQSVWGASRLGWFSPPLTSSAERPDACREGLAIDPAARVVTEWRGGPCRLIPAAESRYAQDSAVPTLQGRPFDSGCPRFFHICLEFANAARTHTNAIRRSARAQARGVRTGPQAGARGSDPAMNSQVRVCHNTRLVRWTIPGAIPQVMLITPLWV